MVYVQADEKSRVCLTKEVTEKYGNNFVLISAKDEIILIPVSNDSLKALQEEGKKIPKNLSLTDLKRIIKEDAEKEALKNLSGK